MGRKETVSKNIIWGFADWIIQTIIPFITRTIMIYTIGIQYVGLGSLFTSLLQVLSFAELGIGSALVYGMYRPIAENDDEKVCALLNFYKKCYRVIGSVILFLGLCMVPFLDHLVAGEVPNGISLKLLFAVYLFNTVIGYFLFAYRSSLFIACQRVDVTKRISMLTGLLKGLLQILFLLCFRNYYWYVYAIPIATILNNILVALLFRRHYPLYICRGNITGIEVQEIRKRVGGLVFQKIGNIVLTSVDTIVISAYLGLKILGIYNGYYYIITALFGVMGTISSAMIPSVGNSVIQDSKEKNYRDLQKFHFLYMWIVTWFCACLLNLYQPFISIWQGKENMLSGTMVVLLVIYFFIHKMGDISFIYKEAMGLWWQGKFVPLISSMVNLTLNIILVRLIGLPGIVISTIVSIALINDTYGTAILFHYYFDSWRRWIYFLRDLVIYFLKAVVVAGCTWGVCRLVSGNGIWVLAGRAAICCIVPNLVIFAINIKNENLKEAIKFLKGVVC